MTLLEELILDDNKTTLKLFEAVEHSSNSSQRKLWSEYGNYFFEENIFKIWCYFNNNEVILPEQLDVEYRREFLKRPTIGIYSNQGNIVGGIWISEVRNKVISKVPITNNSKTAHFHIQIDRNYRQVADKVFDFFLEKVGKKYNYLTIHWGDRDEEDNPSNFLRRKGFKIESSFYCFGGNAILKVK